MCVCMCCIYVRIILCVSREGNNLVDEDHALCVYIMLLTLYCVSGKILNSTGSSFPNRKFRILTSQDVHNFI